MPQREMTAVLATVLWALSMDIACGVVPPTPSGPGFHAAPVGQLRVTTFASGLNFPTSMQQYGGGTWSVPRTVVSFLPSFFNLGNLLLLTDTDNDGVADQTAEFEMWAVFRDKSHRSHGQGICYLSPTTPIHRAR